jgi:hypothetical protein
MSADGVQFPILAVRQHAATVDRVAESAGQARAAVREVTMDTQAYGLLCQFLPGLLAPLFGQAVEAMNGSVEALHETAAGLRSAADSTQATDGAAARRVSAAGPPGGRLPELPL